MHMNSSADPSRSRLLGNTPRVLLFAAVGFVLTAAILQLQVHYRDGQFEPRAVPIFERLFLFEDYPASFLMMAVILIATVFAPVRRMATALAGAVGRHPVITATASFPILCLGAVFAYHAYPLAMDESAPYMQARIFASGHLFAQFPAPLVEWLLDESVRGMFIHASTESGQAASTYWPGFALLLTPFMYLGIPWACNPALGAASVWVIHRLTMQVTKSTEAAGAAILFTLASAAFVINSISFYSMTAHLLCNALYALLLLQAGPRRMLLAGTVGGLALTLHNPVPHALFALPWLLWLMQSRRWRELLLLAAGYLPWVLVVGFGWRHLIEGLGVQPIELVRANAGGSLSNAYALLSTILTIPGPEQLLQRVMALGKIWLWAAPMLVVLAGVGFWRCRRQAAARLLLASAALTFIGYLFVPVSQGHGWGFRYFHSAWFVLPVLAALTFAPSGKDGDDSRAAELGTWSLAGSLGGLFIMVPYFAWQVHAFIGTHLAQMPSAAAGKPKLILVSPRGYYSLDLVQNEPYLREPVIRMASQGWDADQQMVAQYFPDLVLLHRDQRGQVWGLPVPRKD